MEKDADSMVVKPVEYASSEYSASSEAPPVSTQCGISNLNEVSKTPKLSTKHENAIKIRQMKDDRTQLELRTWTL